MNLVLILLTLLQPTDPCSCTPQHGKKPYRLEAKSETQYQAYPVSAVLLTPLAIHRWEKKYTKVANGKKVDRITPRLPNTPEDSLYTLKGYMWFVRREIDCDFHIQIGPAGKQGKKRAVVEVTHENCALQKVIEDTLTARGYQFGKEFPQGIPVTVVGLGFYDYQHRLKKAPPNTPANSPLRKQEGTAWELHPVRAITFP